MSIEIKVGRHAYTITKEDRFMDNGSIVMLLTQSQEKLSWGKRGNPCLSRKLVKQLYKDHNKTNSEFNNVYGRVERFSFDV
jgi:hypothetical protein